MKRFALLLLPILLGVVGSVGITYGFHPEPILAFRIGAGILFLFLGVAASLIMSSFQWGENQGRRSAMGQSDNRHRRFILRLDHELKNPLTGLRAALANWSESVETVDRDRAAANAQRDVERLTRLLADLRKLSDLDAKSLERISLPLSEVVGEMVDAALSLPVHHGREIRLLIANVPSLPPVIGDRDLLAAACYNLIDNALKYSSSSDAVEVRLREEGRQLVLEVADSGIGISPQDLPNLFEELYRGANARGIEGSGLGLALTNRIVRLHGGNLLVTTRQGERKGTVFSIYLPGGRAG
jgi:two-component system, OmpR family, sensor kinase